mmetsp:Transcript_46485/g.116903  ORF Transcript_46485/g.116903 Transcript_46485/m.116903 type:complete len:750 (-) Transcript_46485:172-2421(-)
MGKKPAYATEQDLEAARAELQSQAQQAKEAGERAAKEVRNELLTELGKVSQVVTANAETSKEAIGRVAEDAAEHSQACAVGVKNDILPLLPPIEDKIKKAKLDVEAQLQKIDMDLKTMFAEELTALTQEFDSQLASVKQELMEGAENWARQAAEALVQQRRELDGVIDELRQQMAKKGTDERKTTDDQFTRVIAAQKKSDEAQNERNERAQSEIWLKLERLDELIKENKDFAKEHTDDVDGRATTAIKELRSDAERRLDDLDGQAEKLHDAVAEVENIPTRRVDWVIRNVSKRIRPPSASKASLHCSWFSPKFDMAGAHGLQLELQLFKKADPPVEGEAAGDCAAFLWACKGMNLVYKLYIGNKSAQCEKVFNGRVPYGTKRLCFLKDQINREEDSLRVSVEILEAVREVEHPIKPAPPPEEGAEETEEDIRNKPLEGRVVFRRHVNNRLMDQVNKSVEAMRSRMVRRVEWRLEQASMLRRCFPPGEPMCSVAFAAAGVENLQLMFYPCGYGGATDGFCSLFLYAPAGATMKYILYCGSHRRDAQNFFEESGAYGRTNFCRFESVVEEDTDTIHIVLEVEEAHQDVAARVAHPLCAPGDRRTQSQLEGSLPTATESVVKMHRAPGKPQGGCLEDRRILPSLWTAKSLGDRNSTDTMHSFEDLRVTRMLGSTNRTIGKASEPASPAGASPLGASRSLPSLAREPSTGDLMSRSSGDWTGGLGSTKKGRGSSRTKRNMSSTMEVLQAGTVH